MILFYFIFCYVWLDAFMFAWFCVIKSFLKDTKREKEEEVGLSITSGMNLRPVKSSSRLFLHRKPNRSCDKMTHVVFLFWKVVQSTGVMFFLSSSLSWLPAFSGFLTVVIDLLAPATAQSEGCFCDFCLGVVNETQMSTCSQ